MTVAPTATKSWTGGYINNLPPTRILYCLFFSFLIFYTKSVISPICYRASSYYSLLPPCQSIFPSLHHRYFVQIIVPSLISFFCFSLSTCQTILPSSNLFPLILPNNSSIFTSSSLFFSSLPDSFNFLSLFLFTLPSYSSTFPYPSLYSAKLFFHLFISSLPSQTAPPSSFLFCLYPSKLLCHPSFLYLPFKTTLPSSHLFLSLGPHYV